MLKKLALLAGMLCHILSAGAQHHIYLTIEDPAIISYVTWQGKPGFTVPGVNQLINQYTVTGFTNAFPGSRFHDMRRVYKMEVSSLQLPQDLTAAYGQYFPHYEVIPQTQLAYTPVDYPNLAPFRNTNYLEYIRARAAWDVTKGDTGVIIGITDSYLDVTHPDIATKYVQASPNLVTPGADSGFLSHGTFVAGLAAASTDTSLGSPFYGGYPGIGFQCKIDFSFVLYDPYEMLKISKRQGRRVLNGSWNRGGGSWALDLASNLMEQRIYQEIYEEGVLSCFAAGNSSVYDPRGYAYPASLDYVFSVSGVNHMNTTGSYNVEGMYESTLGDSINNVGLRNARVDLLAPYNDLGGPVYYPGNANPIGRRYKLNHGWGTSWATPLVAGTAALILSVDKCYTPYQLEYILKKSADYTVLSQPPNLKYAGRLGAGSLDAGNALAMVDTNQFNLPLRNAPKTGCNDPATTTFFIEGIDINMVCAPGYSSNGVKPMLKPVLRNGTPNYTYRWEYLPGNNVTLSSMSVANPTITASTGNHKAMLRLTVYDGSSVQKVASRYFTIQLTTANTYDLAGIDSYMDMLDEPNLMDTLDRRDHNFYMSPDLWNRQQKDGITKHENAEYYQAINDSNYAYVRVRNVGCSTSHLGVPIYVKLYWTVASTGENWKKDWAGATTITGAAGGQLPAGGEITTGNGWAVRQLQPGDDTLIVQGWRPVKPQDYPGAPADLNVCLLARLEDIQDSKKGMRIQEVSGPVITNVRNNNNIFTRNLWVADLNPFKRVKKTMALIANADDFNRTVDLQFINDKAIHLHFAGNFSAIGSVKLYLGDLYYLWIDAGGEGSYLERNDEERWVIMDGSQTLELLNLPLAANAKYPVEIEFSLHDNIAIPDYRFDFHLRQFLVDADRGRYPDAYGSMSFQVNTSSEGEGDGRPGIGRQAFPAKGTSKVFSVYPNPAQERITIAHSGSEAVQVDLAIFDMVGRKLYSSAHETFNNTQQELDLSAYVPGVYFINIIYDDGRNEQLKFVKQ